MLRTTWYGRSGTVRAGAQNVPLQYVSGHRENFPPIVQ